jgi:sigma-B regulation protein RsbU (phosphoserine phosphatase)
MSDNTVADSPSFAIRVLLVDDQRMVGEAVRRILANEPNLIYLYCQSPEEAVATAEKFEPTVILQDLVMPGIDGMSLVSLYKQHPKLRDVPTIVLSSQEDPLVKAEAFAKGATDYLVKLPDPIELLARIRHHSKGYIHLLERNLAFEALAESQRVLALELAEASDYVRSLLPAPMKGDIEIRWDFESCSSVGGDSFGYHWIDDDYLVLYLLDVCGHGVGAALLSVSVMNTLSGRSLHDVDLREPDQVLAELNVMFEMEKHNDMYFTIWYGVYCKSTGTLRYATAGHPPALLYSGDAGAPPAQLATPAMPIGTMPIANFKAAEVVIRSGSRLYVYSDGVYEIQLDDGREMQLEEFIPLLQLPLPSDEDGLKTIRHQVGEMQNRHNFDDDFTLVEICFN